MINVTENDFQNNYLHSNEHENVIGTTERKHSKEGNLFQNFQKYGFSI